MKNKGLIYVLLVAVGVIWYNVFFRVVSNLTADETGIVQPNETNQLFSSIERDTFKLNASYRDPFGAKTAVTTTPPPETTKVNPTAIVKKVKVKEPWPHIQYKGMVRKTSSSNPLAIIYIDGIQLQMRKGERVFDGITLKTIHRDSIVIYYQKEKRSFWRE